MASKWSSECIMCKSHDDGTGYDIYNTSLSGSGIHAIQLVIRTIGITFNNDNIINNLWSNRLCSTCFILIDQLDRVEQEYNNIRSEFFRIISNNDKLIAFAPNINTINNTINTNNTDPIIISIKKDIDDDNDNDNDEQDIDMNNDDDDYIPTPDIDSDNEPLVKNKTRKSNKSLQQQQVPGTTESATHDYSCRDCTEGFNSKSEVASHALSVHNINPAEDREIIVSNKNKKRKTKKIKSKLYLYEEEDDEDWQMPKSTRGRKPGKKIDKLLQAAGHIVNQAGSSSADSAQGSSQVKVEANGDIVEIQPTEKKKREKQQLVCSMCPATFTSQTRLDYHMVKHTGSKSPYICEICGAAYKHKKACDIHVSMHKGISPWKCNQCNKIFPSKGALSRHEAIHTGTPNYQCDLCGKSFIHTSSFKMHKLSHTGVKPHSCNKCGLALMTRSHLKRHQRVHSGEKRHECLICGKKFSERYNLYAHQKSHESVAGALQRHKNHDCTVCDATFNRRHILEKHMETMHQRVTESAPRKQRNTMTKLLKQQARELTVGPQSETSISITFEAEDVKITVPSPATTPTVQMNTDSTSSTLMGESAFQQSSSSQPPVLKIEPNTAGGSQEGCSSSGSVLPWQGIINYHLSNDYPLRMHGVDYAGYLNKQ